MSTLHALSSEATVTIQTEELRDRLGDPELAVVDVRPLAAYNGWRLRGEARGGHIPGAVAFPMAWLRASTPPRSERLLDVEGRRRRADGRRLRRRRDDAAAPRSTALVELGHRRRPRPMTAAGGAWAADERTCRSSGCRTTSSSSTSTGCASVLDGEPARGAARAARRLLFHVNFGVPEEYAEGHLPRRALPRHQLARGSRPTGTAARRRRSSTALRALGITHDTTVSSTAATPRATRTRSGRAGEPARSRRRGRRSILRYAGRDGRPPPRRRLRLVGAGGLPARDRPPRAVAGRDLRRQIPQRPELIVDIDEAKQILADPDGAALVSVRTWKEHIGEVSGYNYIGPAGRIAGDVWGNCGTDAYHMQHYRNVDNTMRPYPEIAANWAEAGITRGQVGRVLLRHRLAGERDLVLRAGSWAGSGSRSTTAAGSSGARTRSTTRSRSASPRGGRGRRLASDRARPACPAGTIRR